MLLPAEYLKAFYPWGSPAAAQNLHQWNVLQWDGMAEFYPWRLHAARSMAAGQIPLWDPYVLCGTPFLANSQSAPLYPLHALYYLPLGLSTAVRMGWVAWLHLSLAGVFAYWLARDLGVRPVAALVGGAAYELSGFAVAWLELPSFISVACWIPLLMLLIGRAVRWQSWRTAAGAGAVAGMMLLAGHLQIALYGLLAAGLVWVWETVAVMRTADRATLLRCIGFGCVAVGMGIALAAPQMLPSIELSRVSHRAGSASWGGYHGYLTLAMPPQNWVTLLVPDYYGLPARNDFWGFWKYFAPNTMEYAGHVGAAAFVLVLLGAVCGARVDRRAWLLLGIGALAFLVAIGSPVAALLYFGIPGFSQTGSPARIVVLLCLSQALLAAVGLEWVLQRVEERWTVAARSLAIAVAGTLVLLLALHLVAQLQIHQFEAAVSRPALIRAAAYAAAGGLLPALLLWFLRTDGPRKQTLAAGIAALLVVGLGQVLFGGAYNLTSLPEGAYPDTPLTQALQRGGARVATINRAWDLATFAPAVLPPNASLAYGWRDAQGYDSLALAHYRTLVDAVAGPGDNAGPPANGNIAYVKQPASQLLPLLAAKYVVSIQPVVAPGLSLAQGFPAGPPYVYESSIAYPEAYAASAWIAADDTAGLEYLRRYGPGDIGNSAVVSTESLTPPSPPPSHEETDSPQPAQVERSTPGHIRVTANPKQPVFLVLAESMAPGWKARLLPAGGAPQPLAIHRANIAFQGVFIHPGPATVDWRYEPDSFRLGLFLSLGAVAALLAVGVSRRRAA